MAATLPDTLPPSAAPARTFRAAAHAVVVPKDGAPALLDLRRGVYYTLNELGWRIWDQVSTGVPVARVVRVLRMEYDVPSDTFDAGVTEFLDHLIEASLLEPVA